MPKLNVDKYLSMILSSLEPLPKSLPKPLFIVMVGLPGTGKTFLANCLKETFPISLIQSDQIRGICLRQPKYTRLENKYVFDLCHFVISSLLIRRIPVLFDATNLLEKNRQTLYKISCSNNAKLFLFKITAEPNVAKRRILDRFASNNKVNFSKANWDVYTRMSKFEEPIRIAHTIINNSPNNISCLDPIIEELVTWRNSLYP